MSDHPLMNLFRMVGERGLCLGYLLRGIEIEGSAVWVF